MAFRPVFERFESISPRVAFPAVRFCRLTSLIDRHYILDVLGRRNFEQNYVRKKSKFLSF